MNRLRVLIVDDEAPARQRLRDLLSANSRVADIREAENGREAVTAIRDLRPDMVMLDIQMPEMDGLAVVAEIGADRMPLTVFVTAYDRHAISAFEANALDYLLKPFSDERFDATLARARQRLEDRDMREFGGRLMRLAQAPAPMERLVVKEGGKTSFLSTAEIECIEAAGVYLSVIAGGREILHRGALSDLEAGLDPRKFVRIHRSTIVNIDAIGHLEAISHGEFDVVLRDGRRKRVSRTYRAKLEELLGQSL